MEQTINKVAIVGMGPSGISAAIYLKRSGIDPICFEKGEVGGKLNIIHEIENYPGFLGTGKELSEDFSKQVSHFNINVVHENVLSIMEEEGYFSIRTDAGTYKFLSVIIASGIREKPFDVPNSDTYGNNGISRCAECDGAFYKGKTVAVIGNSTFSLKDASYLASIDGQVIFISEKELPLLSKEKESFLSNKNASILEDYKIISTSGTNHIEKIKLVSNKTKEEKEIEVSALFILLGSTPISEFLGYMDILDSNGNIKTDNKMQTEVKGIFAIGDIHNTPLRQVVSAASDGAIAAISCRQYLLSLKK